MTQITTQSIQSLIKPVSPAKSCCLWHLLRGTSTFWQHLHIIKPCCTGCNTNSKYRNVKVLVLEFWNLKNRPNRTLSLHKQNRKKYHLSLHWCTLPGTTPRYVALSYTQWVGSNISFNISCTEPDLKQCKLAQRHPARVANPSLSCISYSHGPGSFLIFSSFIVAEIHRLPVK